MNTVHASLRPSMLHKTDLFLATEGRHAFDAEQSETGLRDCPRGAPFIRFLEAFRASGGMVQGATVSRLIADHGPGRSQSLTQLVDSGQVFGLTWRSSLWIPMFQFESIDLSLRAGVQLVRASLPNLWSGRRLAHWFATPHEALHLQAPVDCLTTELQAVIAAAAGTRLLCSVRQRTETAPHLA